MTAQECDYHYLVTTEPQDLIKYSTRLDATKAMEDLVRRHAAAGYKTERQQDGRYLSRQPEGGSIGFWIEDSSGAVIT